MSDNPFDWHQRQARRAEAAERRAAKPPPQSANPEPFPTEVDDTASTSKTHSRGQSRRMKRDGYDGGQHDTHTQAHQHDWPRRDPEHREGDRRSYRHRGEDEVASYDRRPRRDRYDSDSHEEDDGRRRATKHYDPAHTYEPGRNTDAARRRRYSRYDEESDDESRHTRAPHPRRGVETRSYGPDRSSWSDRDERDARRRRQEIYDRDRRDRLATDPRRPRHYSDEEEARPRVPREIKVGKYDIGPYVDKGQKHYKRYAPIVTPIVMNLAKSYINGKVAGGRK